MSIDNGLHGTGGIRVPQSRAARLANDVHWVFKQSDQAMLTTEEIQIRLETHLTDVSHLDCVLHRMEEDGNVVSREYNGRTVWAVTTA